ncbi:MAG: MFS transporter, partial [Proteobacteria bacterium]|nr:MFS transporter [Pseudomonadota bacterium]
MTGEAGISQEKMTWAGAGRISMLLGGAIGHFIEWYDWSIYGFMAAVFARQMFPGSSPEASLIASLLAFAIGFLGRPIGAIVLSPLADKYGRRTLLSATILMAGLGSLIIAACPTYASIGIVAPLIITAARLLQGFSAGGEYQIAASFLNEHAPRKSRALAGSPQQVAIGIAVLVATGVASLTTKVFSPDVLASWGWRVPFLIGAVISLWGLYMRLGIAETPVFSAHETEQRRVSLTSIIASIAEFPREVFIVFVIQLGGVQYYLWMIFLPTYAHIAGGLSQSAGFTGSVLASLAYCITVPVFAALSDRVGRRPLLIASAVCFLLFSYPLLAMLTEPNLDFARFTFVAVVGAIFVALNNGVIGTVLAELFPTRVRASGIGIP